MSKTKGMLNVFMWIAITTAMLTGAAVLRHELLLRRANFKSLGQDQSAKQPVTLDESIWKAVSSKGHLIGTNKNAPVVIVELGDYQCVVCRHFAIKTWPVIQRKYGNQVKLLYR